jgi:type IV secretion system protein VirD4
MSRPYRIRLGYCDFTFNGTLWYPGRAHGFLCAPTQTGKFRDFLAELMAGRNAWRGSLLCIDPKCQACSVTARYRAKVLGQEVWRVDPFDMMPRLPGVKWCPPMAQVDPMAELDPRSARFASDADNIAEAAIPESLHLSDSFWQESARGLASGVIMYLKARFPKENLVTVYRVISGPDLFLVARDACRWAQANGIADFIVERLARFADHDAPNSKELHAIIATAITALQFIGNRAIANSLSGSSFRFGDMKRRPITVYLILPGEYLGGNCAHWFRLISGMGVDGFMREPARGVPVLAALDEYKTAVGRLSVIQNFMGLGAGYGCQLLVVLQNLTQLQELHHDWETYLANSGFKVFFAPRDKTTSDYLSDMCGLSEARTVSKSMSEGRDGQLSVNLGFEQRARPYMLPHETRNLREHEALVFGENIPGVIRAGRRPYFLGPDRDCFDPDPYVYGARNEKHGRGLLSTVLGW